ncbi:MAG TPA: hypothetical protein VKA86_05005 [Candidatus Krumholzibacteria bacterium]|nr:hypothetical protein [Candidatus Krumholzibacteria bacterium]
MRTRFLLPVLTLMALQVPIEAAGQLPVSIRASALYARQAATLDATAAGVDLGETDTSANALGAEVRVGIPVVGIDLGLHYLRHFGDVGPEFDDEISGVAEFGLAANEIAIFAEKHYELLPLSPIAPYVGVGASYARIELSDDLDVTAGFDGASDLEASANTARIYAVGGIDLIGGLGLVGRAGYTFSGTYELETDLPLDVDGADANIEVDYDGFYASIGLSLFGI